MAKMDYVTPGLKKINFEDNFFVTTELSGDDNLEVKGYIESRGGIIKNSVTKTTDYLIYGDGKEETTKYEKALELIREKRLEIRVLPLSVFREAGVGEGIMEFGSYPFEEDGIRKPIRWIVLKREKEKALLLSAYGLDAKPYNEKWEAVTRETCTLQKWLNGEFIDTAFTEDEKRRILLTQVRNEANPRWHTPGGNDTEDRVFLLSLGEAEQYLPETFPRQRKPTPFAVKHGAVTNYGGNCWWWLRSPGYYPIHAACVRHGGDIYSGGFVDDCGNLVDDSFIAVCPALWIDLGSEIDPCAEGEKIHERIKKEDHLGT